MLAASLCRSPRSLRLAGTVAAFRGPSHTKLGTQPGPTHKLLLARVRRTDASERYFSRQPEAADAADQPERAKHPGRPTRSLAGKVALVTGAGSRADDGREHEAGYAGLGNGAATAVLLAEAGASVVCVDVLPARAERTAQLVRLEHHHHHRSRDPPGKKREDDAVALALSGDVTNPSDCERLVAETTAQLGRLDILVNVVGAIGAKGDATQVDAAEWATSLELNVSSMMHMAKYAIPAMLRRQRPDNDSNTKNNDCVGSIVNIGSVAGLRGGTPHLLYPTSKGAVVNMTRAMAVHHARHGIRVNCVCPGMLYTPMVAYDADDDDDGRFTVAMSPEMREARRNRSLLRTEGNAWDCAAAVRFLAGDEARWITGSILTVDAGATASTELVW
ncbi:short-chain dehydrogenase/reductase SDR [Magnaporthiopsis poae ATCC 64411]|uniref:Short-chain dehydrogenase/reductase SDR n=1 Tax=Magnaporthiopsis poae (strain ATCC 64411 / 73-15) TaxID=644358 RepID=A0A0C4E041_MAGP6|nr:short-chain dehydrogenase/reductase SDR [Magnaporthiopsis poae ATCC 64411]